MADGQGVPSGFKSSEQHRVVNFWELEERSLAPPKSW